MTSDPENLRVEYAASEQHIGMLNSAVFQSAAIVVGGSIAGLAIAINVSATYWHCVTLSIVGLLVFMVTLLWQYNWRRHSTSIRNRWRRMREIELELGMRANTIAYLLTLNTDLRETTDEWMKLSEDERRLAGFTRYFTLPGIGSGQGVLYSTAYLVLAAWLAVVVAKWVETIA